MFRTSSKEYLAYFSCGCTVAFSNKPKKKNNFRCPGFFNCKRRGKGKLVWIFLAPKKKKPIKKTVNWNHKYYLKQVSITEKCQTESGVRKRAKKKNIWA